MDPTVLGSDWSLRSGTLRKRASLAVDSRDGVVGVLVEDGTAAGAKADHGDDGQEQDLRHQDVVVEHCNASIRELKRTEHHPHDRQMSS